MTLKHMTILVDAYCATYQIDEHMKEIFGSNVINSFSGIAKAFVTPAVTLSRFRNSVTAF